MKENRLTELFNKMSSKDFKRFGDFLESPYYNKNKNLIRLYNYLKKSREYNGSLKLSYKSIAQSLGENYSYQKINALLLEYKNLLSEFILIESLNKNKIRKKINQLISFKEKDASKNLKHLYSSIKKQLISQVDISPENYFYNFISEYTDKSSRIVDIIYSPNHELKELSHKLNLFFVCYKLIIYNLMIRHRIETLFDVSYDFTFKGKIEEFIISNKKEIQKSHPLIYSYYLGMKMNEEKHDDKNFYNYKKFILLQQKKFIPSIFEGLMMELMNSCSDRMDLNREKYIRETFEVYRILDENKIYSADYNIDNINFMNAVLAALEVKNLNWANYFFRKYKDLIQPLYKEDIIHLVMANIFFYKNEFTESLSELNQINSKKFYFYLRIRVLRIKIYFELAEFEAVSYLVDTVKHYIKRNKQLIGTNFEVVNSFLDYIKKIIRFKVTDNSDGLSSVKKVIQSDNIVAAKNWFLEKLKEY